ncbi:MAG TPA: response regulator, partial [Parvularculaceae bacterium]|nr:response regulator [Parvularculaceae bacterium]
GAQQTARFAAHLSKPVRPSQLMDVLARVLYDQSPTADRYTTAVAGAASPAAAPPANRIKLLVAEDNAVNQLVVKNMLNDDRYDVVFAENGERAVELFLEIEPAIILMDLSMPVMDGYEATRRIRNVEAERGLPRTPIIATTAHVLEEDRRRCRLAGMDDFLAKPIRKARIEEILERSLADPSRERRLRVV